MKFRFLLKYLIIILIPLNIIQPVKADLASDLLKLAGDASKKNKKELAKWGLKSSKDIKKLKSKEIKLLISGNVLEGIYNDNEKKGKTVEEYNKDGTYTGIVLGKKETAKWYVKEGKLCYKSGFTGCAKVYKSKSEPVVYFLKQQGIIYSKFTKVTSIEEVEKIKKAAKEKKLAEEKAAKEKKLAEEKAANEKIEKKLLLLPDQTDLEKAQNFLNSIKDFVKLFPDEFDIIKISEFLISTKSISDGNLDAELKDDLELFKEFANSSSEFVKYYKTLEIMRKDKEIKKIDQTILSLEQNVKTIKGFLVNNSDSIYVEQWLDDLKKAKKILNNPTSHDELLIENDRLSNVVLNGQKIDKAKIDAKLTIVELKENLKLNLTSDLAPLIIEQVKSLEQAIKKENIEDLTSANKIAKEFIFKQFEEPKLKTTEEKRIADAKALEEYKKSPEGIKEEKERVKKEKERLRIEKENEGIHFYAKMLCRETKKAGPILSEEEIGVWGAMGIASENLYYINEVVPKIACKCIFRETKKAISLERTKEINALYKKDKKADGVMTTREQNFFGSLPRMCAPTEEDMSFWMKGGRP